MYCEINSTIFFQSTAKSDLNSNNEMIVSPTRLLAVAIRKRRELFEEKDADLKLQIFHTSMIRALCKQMGEGRAKNKRSHRSSPRSQSQKRRWSDNSGFDDQDSGFESTSSSVSPPSPSSPSSQIVPYERNKFDFYSPSPPSFLNGNADDRNGYKNVDAPSASKRNKLNGDKPSEFCSAFSSDWTTTSTSMEMDAITAEFNADFRLDELAGRSFDNAGETMTANRLPTDYAMTSSYTDPSCTFNVSAYNRQHWLINSAALFGLVT